jgi:hypothetical protein
VPWARVDDGWWCHPKVMGLSLAASGLWVRALSWSCAQRRDLVPQTFVQMIGGTPTETAELVACGLWIEAEDGWTIHDWSEYQQQTVSEKRAEAGRKGGSRPSPYAGETQAKSKQTPSNGASKEQASEQAGTRPVPTQKKGLTSAVDNTVTAMRSRMAINARRANGESCFQCDDTGHVDSVTRPGSVQPCPECRPGVA